MAYLKTIQVKNGDYLVDFNIYKCDITGEEIPENFGWYGNENIHISQKGMEIIIEDWIERNSNSCGVPAFLYYLEKRLCKKIRRESYIPESLKKEVLRKYKHTCQHCGTKENLTYDHIHPVSKGGLTELLNLQILCKSCNSKKGTKI